jgi:hypothetical protein
MPVPGPFARVLTVAALLAAGVVAAVGGLALRAPGVVAVGVAGVLAGLTAAAIARDAPGHSVRRTVEAAAMGTAGTVGVLLVVSGTAALTGAAGVALLLLVVAGVALTRVWFRISRAERAASSRAGLGSVTGRPHPSALAGPGTSAPAAGGPEQAAPVSWLLLPVAGLSTAALGDEWVHTTAALAGRLAPSVRRAIVERREAALDELERRDPAGFARWMAGGPEAGSDPAQFVRGGPAADTEAA